MRDSRGRAGGFSRGLYLLFLCFTASFAALTAVNRICGEPWSLFFLDAVSGFADNPRYLCVLALLTLGLALVFLYCFWGLHGVTEVRWTVCIGKRRLRYTSFSWLRGFRPGVFFAAVLLCGLCVWDVVRDAGERNLWRGDTAIAHALGAIDGFVYTNSLEAFEKSYALGFRTFEADMLQTVDGEVILTHDLENPGVTGKEFLQTPILGQYTAMSFEDLCRLMEEYPDIWVVTDTKYADTASVKKEFTSMRHTGVSSVSTEDTLNRFIIQIYNENMYETVREIYPFQSYIFTLYQRWNGDAEEFTDICRWCRANRVEVITMPDTLLTGEIADTAERYGVAVYVHTVDDPSAARRFLEEGVDGVYTNTLPPSALAPRPERGALPGG